MGLRVEIETLPACWASALINNDFTGLEDEEIKALEAALERIAPGLVVDVCRDDDTGDSMEPYFSWSYGLHGGTAKGGDLLDYVVHYHDAPAAPEWRRPIAV